ncbi:MAG: isochorismatase family protein [Pseudomonadota bacterium]
MALTTLDPKTALIVIDLQKGIVSLPPADVAADVVRHTRTLLDAFRARNLPVVLVNVDRGAPGRTERAFNIRDMPPDWTDLIPELNRQPGDIVVTKHSWGAFATTDLDTQLKARGVTQVVIAGVATGTGVEATARQAYEAGFNVTLAVDAMTDMRAEAHAYSVASVFPRLGETGTAQDVINLLDQRSA